MSRNYYRENVWLPWWVLLLFLGVIAFLSALLVVQSQPVLPAWWNPPPTIVLLVLIGLFGLILLNFMRLSITADSENIRVGYGILRKTISWKEVVSCQVTKAKFRVYGRVGVGLGVDNTLAFTTSFGNAVQIMRTNGLPFVFSTKNPTKLSKIINEHSNSSSHSNLLGS